MTHAAAVAFWLQVWWAPVLLLGRDCQQLLLLLTQQSSFDCVLLHTPKTFKPCQMGTSHKWQQ
jgi:hypothetical protein